MAAAHLLHHLRHWQCDGMPLNRKLPNTYYRTLCKEAGWVYSHVDDETGSRIFVNGTIVSRCA